MASEAYYTSPKYCQADTCRSRRLVPFPSVADGKRVIPGVPVQTIVWVSVSESYRVETVRAASMLLRLARYNEPVNRKECEGDPGSTIILFPSDPECICDS